jgi:predicted  nucleic acid-binding Zn-ribbon protein
MEDATQAAFDWAMASEYQSVAARHAKLLAKEIERLEAENKRLQTENVAAAAEIERLKADFAALGRSLMRGEEENAELREDLETERARVNVIRSALMMEAVEGK